LKQKYRKIKEIMQEKLHII